MLDLNITNRYTTLPQLPTTLWHCDQCDAFISIHSVQVLDQACCPACSDVLLEFCGTIGSIPGIQFADA
jgi:uncharacterized paraquat-inducible protein A